MSPPRLGSRTVHESWPLTRFLSHVAFVTRTWTVSVSHVRGSVDARLKLEDVPLDLLPGERFPSIHRCSCDRGHSVCTSTGPSTFHVTGALSAYPAAFPWAFASEPIPLLTRMRWIPTPHWQCGERVRSYSVPGCGLSLRAGPHCSPGDVMGCSLEHAISCPASERVPPPVSPCPFWTKPITSVGLFYLTTIQP